tara:strand:+ start:2288 stop:3460 length:1173 start_codon:yes stop_codon:yes gene_type:complete
LKKITVFTGSRAEFGLQLPLLDELKKSKDIDLSLVIGASHIDPNFGLTINEIKKHGYNSEHLVDFTHEEDSLYSNPLTVAKGVELIAKKLNELQPDLFIVYADRYESFAAVVASTQMGILTAHFEGGDITEGGTFDDSVRHAMTKLSHLHFTTNKEATKRIIKMGEDEKNVFTVGLPSIDLIKKMDFTNSKELIKKYNINENSKLIIFTQHPIPIKTDYLDEELGEIESALIELDKKEYKVICSYPNSDIGSETIINSINKWSEKNNNIDVYKSLGRRDFHGLLNLNNSEEKIQVAYMGNSSAGIKETPALRCPAIILGERQNGRLHAENIIFSKIEKQEIISSVEKAFNLGDLKEITQHYGDGSMAKKTIGILEKISIDKELMIKKFND